VTQSDDPSANSWTTWKVVIGDVESGIKDGWVIIQELDNIGSATAAEFAYEIE
jgi:hypothetical protein